MLMNQCLHFNVCQDDVNDFDVGVNESIFFLFCMPNDAYECPKVLLNVD